MDPVADFVGNRINTDLDPNPDHIFLTFFSSFKKVLFILILCGFPNYHDLDFREEKYAEDLITNESHNTRIFCSMHFFSGDKRESQTCKRHIHSLYLHILSI